jgi:hypothetical protein
MGGRMDIDFWLQRIEIRNLRGLSILDIDLGNGSRTVIIRTNDSCTRGCANLTARLAVLEGVR